MEGGREGRGAGREGEKGREEKREREREGGGGWVCELGREGGKGVCVRERGREGE